MNHELILRRFTTLALVSAAFAIPVAQADDGSGGSGQPDTKHAARLVSLGHGRCGDLEIFVLIINGHRSLPMC